jgi:alkylhydroperoxidase/carboxymuconolactone decarboxylase family protein YurZ
MHMSRQPANHYLNLKKRHEELITAVEALAQAARKSGPLDEKSVHLVQLAAAAALMSHGSTRSHTIRALEAGAKPEEVRHAVIVLTSTIGFPLVAAALETVDEAIATF